MSIKDTYYAALSTDAMPGIFEFQRNNIRALRPTLQNVSHLKHLPFTHIWLWKIVKNVHVLFWWKSNDSLPCIDTFKDEFDHVLQTDKLSWDSVDLFFL